MQRLTRCQTLDTQGRYEEAITCYTEKAKQIVYVNEYQPSSAKITQGDPIYRKSSETERLQIGRLAEPSPIAILIILGIIYFITR